jgi:hypothetical protein
MLILPARVGTGMAQRDTVVRFPEPTPQWLLQPRALRLAASASGQRERREPPARRCWHHEPFPVGASNTNH